MLPMSMIVAVAAISATVLSCHTPSAAGPPASRATPEAPAGKAVTQPSVTAAEPVVSPPPAPAAASPAARAVGTNPGHAGAGTPLLPSAGNELAAFAEGCFWGSEDTFRHVEGVVATAVGYTGGHTANPSYEDVCTHTTGHAETVLVEFDPTKVTYAQLLHAFWDSHDPTTLNRQGPDVGDQYRSAIFTFSPEQAAAARASLAQEQPSHKDKITTEIAPIGRFWRAEAYHQQFDERTGRHSCPIPHRTNAT